MKSFVAIGCLVCSLFAIDKARAEGLFAVCLTLDSRTSCGGAMTYANAQAESDRLVRFRDTYVDSDAVIWIASFGGK